MKALTLIALGSLAVVFAAHHARAAETTKPSAPTLENLTTAMHGESYAFAKYTLFERQALAHGNKQLAKVFHDAAQTERLQHFAEEAGLAGLVGSDADNLRDAIKGESYEVDTMYADFAKQASAAGDKAASDRFEEVRQDEMKHRDAFKAELEKLEKARHPAVP